MRYAGFLIGLLALVPLGLEAGEKESRPDYADFSRLLHVMVVRQLPKEFEESSGWGQTIPAPPNLPFPNLRKYVKVGDRLEVPHGAWRRFKGKIEDPDKNLKITVKDFRKLDDKNYRLVVDADAIITGQAEWEQWQKGLLLFGLEGIADARLKSAVVCDIAVIFNLTKFPPTVNIEPKVTDLALDLVDFKMRGGPFLKGEKGDLLRKDILDLMRAGVKTAEPLVKDQANAAIAQSLKEGKGTISADAILKAVPRPK
jgi:hypothetical protein